MKSNLKKRKELLKKVHEKKLPNNIIKNKVNLYIKYPRGYTLKAVEVCSDEHKKYILN